MPAVSNFDGGLTVSFRCTDRKKTTAWFETMLGFRLLYDAAEIGWCELATHVKNVNIGLGESREVQAGGAVPTFGVVNLDVARSALEAKGVKFDGATTVIPGMVKLATFFDPDRNALMLYQDLSKNP